MAFKHAVRESQKVIGLYICSATLLGPVFHAVFGAVFLSGRTKTAWHVGDSRIT